jgi:hypothetical protein
MSRSVLGGAASDRDRATEADLTARQVAVLAAVREHGAGLSVRRICAATGIRSTGVVHDALIRLQMVGLLAAGPTAQRRLADRGGQPPRPRRRRRAQLYLVGSTTEVDEVAVWRALAGDPARRLGIAERVHAVRITAGRGWSDSRTADRLGISKRSVVRIRAEHGIPSGVPCTRRAAA